MGSNEHVTTWYGRASDHHSTGAPDSVVLSHYFWLECNERVVVLKLDDFEALLNLLHADISRDESLHDEALKTHRAALDHARRIFAPHRA